MIDELQKKYPDSDKLSWNTDTDNFDVLNESDVLISDFSGVIFDFSLVFDKPVIYTPNEFDKSTYDAAWLEEDLWTYDILPEIGVELSEDNFGNVKALIDECVKSTKLSEGRNRARREAWMNIGHSAEKTVDFILGKKSEFETSKDDETTAELEAVEEVTES